VRRVFILLAWLLVSTAWGAAALAGEECGPKPPLHPVLHRVMYQAQGLMAQQPERAAVILEDFARDNPEFRHYSFYFLRGVLAYQLGRLDAAKELFTQTVKLRPCYVAGLNNLAMVLYQQKKPVKAAELMLKAYGFSKPVDPRFLYEAAVLFLAADRPEVALAHLQRLAALAKPEKSWLLTLLHTHLKLKQTREAQAVLRRLLDLSPGEVDLWRTSANLNLERRRFVSAAGDLEVAYRLKEPDPADWRTLSDIYLAAKVPLKAALCYQRSLGKAPTAAQLDRLAEIYLQGNYLEQALESAQAAAALAPSAARFALLGRIYMQKKLYKQAFEAFSRAAHPPGKNTASYHLLAGYCAWQMEDLAGAQKSLAQALKQASPGSALAKEAAQNLAAIKDHQRQKGIF